jgi:hypothetical protein
MVCKRMSATTTITERDRNGRFVIGGKPGPGRPKGARSRFSENFLEAFASDFEQHGASVIEKVRVTRPGLYLRIAADLLPKEAQLDLNVDVLHGARSTIEAYRTLVDIVGGAPDVGLRRLKRLAPQIVDAEPT